MPFGVYISVPFCRTKCSYCNFASDVFSRAVFERYVDRVCADIENAPQVAAEMGGQMERAHGIDASRRREGGAVDLTILRRKCPRACRRKGANEDDHDMTKDGATESQKNNTPNCRCVTAAIDAFYRSRAS